MKKRGELFLVLLAFLSNSLFLYTQEPFRRSRKPSGQFANFMGHIGKNIFDTHKNIFSWDSFKIVTMTFPFFVGARMIDEKLQRCFYNQKNHKNTNQIPEWCHEVARWSIGVPIALLGMQSFLSRDEEFRTTSQVFLIGVPFVFSGKKVN